MNKTELEQMLESVKGKITEAFNKMLETATDDDVKKYENLLKQAHKLEEQLALLEKAENKGTTKPPEVISASKALEEKKTFVKNLVEAVSKGTTFSGVLPRDVSAEIQRKKEDIAKVRGLCTIHQATGEYTVYVEGDGATVAYVGEGATIGETSPSIKPIALAALKLAAIVKVSREFLSDLGVDVMAYLIDVLSKAFAKKEDAEILFGAGTDTSKTALRGISTGALAANTVTAASATAVTWAEVKQTIEALKAYRSNATIVCSQGFLDMVHEFKDGSSYMFPQQSPITSIMGVKVLVSDEFPAIAAGKVAMIVGDFSYYHILDRQGLEVVTLNELYAATDQVGIRALERIDGDFVPDAFAVLKMKAS